MQYSLMTPRISLTLTPFHRVSCMRRSRIPLRFTKSATFLDLPDGVPALTVPPEVSSLDELVWPSVALVYRNSGFFATIMGDVLAFRLLLLRILTRVVTIFVRLSTYLPGPDTDIDIDTCKLVCHRKRSYFVRPIFEQTNPNVSFFSIVSLSVQSILFNAISRF